MCAILDANVAGQVFGAGRPPAGAEFFEWIDSGRGRLVVGGRLRRELDRLTAFREWRRQSVLAGRVTLLNDEDVDGRAKELAQENACRSDDEHIVAVAQLGGARLLFTNDGDLQADSKDRDLVDDPRGEGIHDASSRRLDTGPSPPACGPHPVWEQGPMTMGDGCLSFR